MNGPILRLGWYADVELSMGPIECSRAELGLRLSRRGRDADSGTALSMAALIYTISEVYVCPASRGEQMGVLGGIAMPSIQLWLRTMFQPNLC